MTGPAGEVPDDRGVTGAGLSAFRLAEGALGDRDEGRQGWKRTGKDTAGIPTEDPQGQEGGEEHQTVTEVRIMQTSLTRQSHPSSS